MIYRAHNIDNVVLGLILVGLGTFLRSMGITGDLGLFESLMGLSPALIVAGTLALEPTLRRAPSVLLHTIGNASYSIYLSHLFFLRISELSWRHFVGFGSSKNVGNDVRRIFFHFCNRRRDRRAFLHRASNAAPIHD